MGNGMQSPLSPKDRLLHELKDPVKRRAFVEGHARDTIASQLRMLRTAREWEQADVAERLGNRRLQPMVSRYENPDYGRYSVRTLLELAEVFDVALVVRFEPFSELVRWDWASSATTLCPPGFEKDGRLSQLEAEIRIASDEGDGTSPRVGGSLSPGPIVRNNTSRSEPSKFERGTRIETDGEVHRELSPAVEMVQVHRLADVFGSITQDEVRRMLEGVDRRTAKGRRDYAILLLLVTYGLRVEEVANLTLDDLDWERERLQVPEGKAGQSAAHPLAGSVAEALIDYLQQGRPETTDRHVFMRTLAPRAPISAGAVYSSVALYLRKAGIQVHLPGARALRRKCVQRRVDAKLPLKRISDYMGHRPSQSIQVYAKAPIASVREVALRDGDTP